MQLFAINALKDNYIWALVTPSSTCIIIDPGETQPVLDFLTAHHLTLAGILVTHHHPDHTGGLPQLSEQYTAPVYGHAKSPCPFITHHIDHENPFTIPTLLPPIHPLMTPGHTLCHITFLVEHYAFTGDTLFSAGCGKVFEGTMPMLHDSLEKISQLPPDTQICCGHEYTLANLAFASLVESNNTAITHHMNWAKKQRDNNQPTLPSTLAQEHKINPFLRCHLPTVIQSVDDYWQQKHHTPTAVFAGLRSWKDQR